jgi:hypothetical protein
MYKGNKALDFNKLLGDQAKGKLLKKHLSFPLYAEIKYDGNATLIKKDAEGLITFITSGGHIYDNDEPTVFHLDSSLPIGVYLCERIGTDGKLGDRVNCPLRGSRGSQTAYGHKYIIHDRLALEEYEAGESIVPFYMRRNWLEDNVPDQHLAKCTIINTREELDDYLKFVVSLGYEGLMLKDPEWYWKDTKSRTVQLAKYKKRPTADLLCVGTTRGEGKYEGMIGALVLQDKQGRTVSVGSGLSDEDRSELNSYFLREVIEIEYEQIIDTYIQPTFIQVRHDKTKEDID